MLGTTQDASRYSFIGPPRHCVEGATGRYRVRLRRAQAANRVTEPAPGQTQIALSDPKAVLLLPPPPTMALILLGLFAVVCSGNLSQIRNHMTLCS